MLTKSTFIQFSGVLLVLGGVFGALSAFSQFQPDDHYSYYGIFQILILFMAPGWLLTGLGCIGVALRYEHSLGIIGRWTLYLCALGSLVMAVGVVATQIQDSFWNLWMIGGVLHVTGLTLFGLWHVRWPALPIFRALPLQMATGWLAIMFGILQTSSQTTTNLLSFLIIFGMGLGWLAIGLTIRKRQEDTQVSVVA